MKKLISILMVCALAMGLTACAETSTNESVSAENGKIGLSLTTMSGEFMTSFDDNFRKKFGDNGYEVITVSCENNPATQVADLENLITMGVESIFLFAVDPEAITDVMMKARKEGIKVVAMASDFNNIEAYDVNLGTDQMATGVGCAQMAADWVDKVFPDAGESSIEVVIVGSTMSSQASARTDGMYKIEELNPKCKVVEMMDLAGANDMAIKSQEYADLIVSKYPDCKVILYYGESAARGGDEVFLRQPDLNRDEFALFSVDTTDAILESIKLSETNDSLIRGTICFGKDLAESCWNCFTGNYESLTEKKEYLDPIELVVPENVSEFMKE